MRIRKAEVRDWPEIWPMFKEIVSKGETYAWSPEIGFDEAKAKWFAPEAEVFLADEGGIMLGSYRLMPNVEDLGDHVANGAFMVSREARGKGVGRALGKHAIKTAADRGFKAMQFNYVVASNHTAVKLWQSLGFKIVGAVPGAFRHRKLGLTDIHIMHREL